MPSVADQTPGSTEHLLGGTAANRQAQGHFGMALGWLKRGRIDRAIISLEHALSADPTYPDTYLELARLLLERRRWADLAVLCKRGLKYFIEISEFHKLLITAIEAQGSLDDADAYYGLKRLDQRALELAPDAILCCAAVRNERARLPYFLDYYRRLGVDRFLVIDNGSDDGSVEWLLSQPDLHLWGSELPFKLANFGSSWFELLLRRHGVGHWCLTVDADEFLTYAGAPERPLRTFCADLAARGKQAATGVLLDLYGDRPVSETHYRPSDDPLALCPFFDRVYFHTRFEQDRQYGNQALYFGGVRQRVFPAEHDYLLNKCVLFRYAPDCVLNSGQHLTNIPAERLAISNVCVLHYKFFSSFLDYARTEAAREMHAQGGEQYKAYQRELSRQRDLVLYDPEHSIRFQGIEQLVQLAVMRPEDAPDTVGAAAATGALGRLNKALREFDHGERG